MSLPIIEDTLYGLVTFETATAGGTLTWVDASHYVTDINYSEGGRVIDLGTSLCDVGTMTVSFRDIPTVPAIGAYVRLRRTGTSEYIFTGYVQDVSQQVIFDDSVTYTTPVVLTNLVIADWVGLLSQFTVNGITGKTSGGADASIPYTSDKRVHAINYSIDSTMATTMVSHVGTAAGNITHTDAELSATAHLDLLSWSMGGYWYGTHNLPTNNTTGRDNLVEFRVGSGASSGKTFTDVAGTSGQLHYTEIELLNTSANIANRVDLNNRSMLVIENEDVTSVAGGNISDRVKTYTTDLIAGLVFDNTYSSEDATSISTYGERYSSLDTNLALLPEDHYGVSDYNLCSNPNAGYDSNGYRTNQSSTTRVMRRKPSETGTLADADGEWAIKIKATAADTPTVRFEGFEGDGTPVTAGQRYRFDCKIAKTGTNQVRARAVIEWYTDDGSSLGDTNGSWLNLTEDQWDDFYVEGVAGTKAFRAVLKIDLTKHDGTSLAKGAEAWWCALNFYRIASTGDTMTYFTGDYPDTDSVLHYWTGEVGNSASVRVLNSLKTRADAVVSAFSTTSLRVSRIRWNAQEDLTAVSSLTVGKTISLVYKGTTTTYRIIGVDGSLNPYRYMIDYYLVKV